MLLRRAPLLQGAQGGLLFIAQRAHGRWNFPRF
jgi:hypothetical protein